MTLTSLLGIENVLGTVTTHGIESPRRLRTFLEYAIKRGISIERIYTARTAFDGKMPMVIGWGFKTWAGTISEADAAAIIAMFPAASVMKV